MTFRTEDEDKAIDEIEGPPVIMFQFPLLFLLCTVCFLLGCLFGWWIA